MLKKQRLILAGASVAGVLVLYGAAAYWSGLKAEETLAEQHKMLSQLPFFKVKSHVYERGWFTSTETTELVFNRKLFAPYESLMPDNVRPLLNRTIRYTHTVRHGPLPGLTEGHFQPARALVTTEFSMSDETRRTLAKFFGDQPPITVVNRLGFGGGGELSVTVPAFDYEETLSGVHMKWQGFTLKVDYASGYQEYKTDASTPGFVLQAATKGSLSLGPLRYLSDIRPGTTGVKLGTSELTVDAVGLNWKEAVPYSIKLNELVFLLTRMRVGEFINPSGELRPSNVALKKLRYQIVTSEQDSFINTRGKLDFETFRYNDQLYGPLRLDVSANHLHGPTLVRLDKTISAIPVEGVDPAVLRQRYLDTIKTEGLPLLENNPRLVINELYLKMPNGEARLTGNLGLQGFTRSDLDNPTAFLKRFNVEAKVDLPRRTLDDLVVAQARNLFTVDASAEEQPSLEEIDSLALSLLDTQLAQWTEQGYLTQNQGQVATEFVFRNGELRVRNHKVALPWEEADITPGEPASAAQ
ncbi:Uncharacterized conserved protein YdgA, DUF945 family [Gulbenkiania indica]|uniref:Uncharacterized conserved protein YdgA, DUF945 family n=1 Tax=Gulbenkiania indica TaxID=375574 RepID=A0A0K6H4E6_9NEIS|nr:YdgA family protein [Gulbenkiania indica]CUA85697.1 Uncharacterized conserved protein YdgA, DUF945 family [Gulbenkiania indica]